MHPGECSSDLGGEPPARWCGRGLCLGPGLWPGVLAPCVPLGDPHAGVSGGVLGKSGVVCPLRAAGGARGSGSSTLWVEKRGFLLLGMAVFGSSNGEAQLAQQPLVGVQAVLQLQPLPRSLSRSSCIRSISLASPRCLVPGDRLAAPGPRVLQGGASQQLSAARGYRLYTRQCSDLANPAPRVPSTADTAQKKRV